LSPRTLIQGACILVRQSLPYKMRRHLAMQGILVLPVLSDHLSMLPLILAPPTLLPQPPRPMHMFVARKLRANDASNAPGLRDAVCRGS
jgi:hypothetical protein